MLRRSRGRDRGLDLGILSLRHLFFGGLHLADGAYYSTAQPSFPDGFASRKFATAFTLAWLWFAKRPGDTHRADRAFGIAPAGWMGLLSPASEEPTLASFRSRGGIGIGRFHLSLVHPQLSHLPQAHSFPR